MWASKASLWCAWAASTSSVRALVCSNAIAVRSLSLFFTFRTVKNIAFKMPTKCIFRMEHICMWGDCELFDSMANDVLVTHKWLLIAFSLVFLEIQINFNRHDRTRVYWTFERILIMHAVCKIAFLFVSKIFVVKIRRTAAAAADTYSLDWNPIDCKPFEIF